MQPNGPYLSLHLFFCFEALFLFVVCIALRELFRAKLGDYPSSDFSSGELMRESREHQSENGMNVEAQREEDDGSVKEDIKEEVVKLPSEHASLVGLNDAADEFFDVSEPLDFDQSEDGWPSDFGPDMYSQVRLVLSIFCLGMAMDRVWPNPDLTRLST